jgi:hypothetical protein
MCFYKSDIGRKKCGDLLQEVPKSHSSNPFGGFFARPSLKNIHEK